MYLQARIYIYIYIYYLHTYAYKKIYREREGDTYVYIYIHIIHTHTYIYRNNKFFFAPMFFPRFSEKPLSWLSWLHTSQVSWVGSSSLVIHMKLTREEDAVDVLKATCCGISGG